MYKNISRINIDKFEDLLFNSNFTRKGIKLEIPKLDIGINIDGVSFAESICESQYSCSFLNNESLDVVEHKGKKYGLGLEIWERNLDDNKYSINISLSCDCDDFNSGFGENFYQIELADALEDNENIYLVRNITKFFNNALSLEVDEYGSEILFYKNEKFLLISKFKKSSFDDIIKHYEIYSDFLKKFIKCAFINEGFKLEFDDTK
ncbi:hypothetical protein [Clostridium sp.]|uniref:hypothetical protein n=1 Tax=Clostridium sp. TaxID=1506 RepID=UPI003D6CFEB3